MLKVIYEVKVWVGGTDDIPAIGLSGGVCTWSREVGILSDEWWGGISSTVDISSSGNYETYSPTSVNIMKSKIIEKTLNNYGLTLTGKRLEIHEITSTTRILYRGIIDKMAYSGNNEVKISVSHLVNKYNTNLTNKVGKDYTYLVYGNDVDGVPLVVDKDAVSMEVGAIGADEYYPAFRNITTEQDERYLLIEPVYDKTLVSYDDIVEFFEKSQYFMIEGKESYVATLFSITDDAKISILMAIKPCRYKISTGEEAIPLNDVAIVKYAYQSSIYYPSGSIVSGNDIYLENGNKVPFYIDSIKYEDDRVDLLDADNVGFSYVEPKRTRFANDQELKELNGDDVILAGAQGVSIYSDENTSITAKSATSANGENLGYRESVPVSNASIDLTGGINGLDFGYISYSFTGAYDIESPEDYDQLNCSMEATLKDVKALASENVYWSWDITSKIMVKTVGGIREVSTSQTVETLIGNGSNSITVDDFKLPLTVASDVENRAFRFSNESKSQRLWYSVDLFSELEEYEKKNPITVFYIVTVGTTMIREDVNMLATLESMKINAFSQESYSLGEMYADNVNGKTGVSTIAEMYIDACSRQNLYSLGFATPSSGWGLEIPAGDITQAVNTVDITSEAPTEQIKYKADETGTKSVKLDLLEYGFGIGFIDKNGLESWADIMNMYNDGGVNITAYDVIGKPSVVGFNSNRVYCDIGITTHEGNFTITNTEQETASYDTSYTSGFDSGVGKTLWMLGNILYKKYAVKNEYLKNMADADAIVDEETYIKNQYAIAGAVSVSDGATLYERYTLKIKLPTEFVIANDMWKGDNIVFTFPHIASLHTGIITGFGKDIGKEVYSITAEMVGEVLDSTEVFTIIESGSQPDNIIESGSQDNNYIEAV